MLWDSCTGFPTEANAQKPNFWSFRSYIIKRTDRCCSFSHCQHCLNCFRNSPTCRAGIQLRHFSDNLDTARCWSFDLQQRDKRVSQPLSDLAAGNPPHRQRELLVPPCPVLWKLNGSSEWTGRVEQHISVPGSSQFWSQSEQMNMKSTYLLQITRGKCANEEIQ